MDGLENILKLESIIGAGQLIIEGCNRSFSFEVVNRRCKEKVLKNGHTIFLSSGSSCFKFRELSFPARVTQKA